MLKKVIALLTAVFALTACSEKEQRQELVTIDASFVKSLVLNAIAGSGSANDSLSGLIDLNLPINNDYNKAEVNLMQISGDKTFFTVLIEYPNPVYNRFGLYDSLLTPYLIDKSLSGQLDYQLLQISGNSLINLNEGFISKDVFKLIRSSIYKLTDTSAALVFRAFTRLESPDNSYFQRIVDISEERIRTEINSLKNSPVKNKGDVFLFDAQLNIYSSSQNTFDNFLFELIQAYNKRIERPSIDDESTALKSTGIEPGENTMLTSSVKPGKGSFTLTLTDDWKELKNLGITDHLKKKLIGTKFVNNSLGSYLSIVMLPFEDSAESVTDYKLTNSAVGNYTVRYSDKIEGKKYYLQFFEYSCGGNKFLMIFEASKFTYEQYKNIYETIINSFQMDC
jgi:hypothetical protein